MLLVLGVLLAAAVLMNQLREKALTGKLYRQPAALLLFAGLSLSFMHALTGADWLMLLTTGAVAFTLGLLQGRYSPLIHHDGAWYVSGSLLAACVWLTSIPVRYALYALTVRFLSPTPALIGASTFIVYLTFIGALLLGRYSMLFVRYPQFLRCVGQNEKQLRRQRGL
ncbi:MAG: hypothetical protein ABF868_01390 [Sporolactobacillus sp.]